ncbi:AMP-dependent synthetase and ligase [Methanotorris formicicus Mc-S-70]|uniref:AMP-dependent synthetase and ligase n=1 Tax=Methanotorris formicicus Mc-S-70 TaxID=647171 RepID=H1KYT7_9EURY|nr:AMP-dependent synthetase and ligase [Methanotorris formicicus Mc-S-70]
MKLGDKYIPMEKFNKLKEEFSKNPEKFWAEQAKCLDWDKTWDKVLEWNYPYARWFVNGKLNACYNCLDRHIKGNKRNKAAIIWGDENENRRILTYYELYREVNKFSNVLQNLGVECGDRVAIYLPMIPEAIVAMLSCARIGAIHTVVFSGFSSDALAERINDAGAKILITADVLYRRGKKISLKNIVDKALLNCPTINHVVYVHRDKENDIKLVEGRDYLWEELMKGAKKYVKPVSVDSNHPLFILYTSGTTGKPRGSCIQLGVIWFM